MQHESKRKIGHLIRGFSNKHNTLHFLEQNRNIVKYLSTSCLNDCLNKTSCAFSVKNTLCRKSGHCPMNDDFWCSLRTLAMPTLPTLQQAREIIVKEK